jgi:hypothetical protein
MTNMVLISTINLHLYGPGPYIFTIFEPTTPFNDPRFERHSVDL